MNLLFIILINLYLNVHALCVFWVFVFLQQLEFSGDEITQNYFGLNHSSYNRLWSKALPDTVDFSGQDTSCFNMPLPVLPLEHCTPSKTRASPGPEQIKERSITIPRPQAQKIITKPGAAPSPTVPLLQNIRQDKKLVVENVKKQMIEPALNTPTLTESQPLSTDLGPDLLCLLDPFRVGVEPSDPSPSSQPSLTAFQGQNSQVPHHVFQKYYNPANPFSTAYISPQATAYLHTPPVLMFNQASHTHEATINGAWIVDSASPASSSSTSLFSLIDSPTPSCLSKALPPSHQTEKPDDPFSDLLTMARSSTVVTTQTKRKIEDLHRKWETFD